MKPITIQTVEKAFNKIKKKKSSGSDGITQEQLVSGMTTLKTPLLQIFNVSLSEGSFPSKWKEAIVTPVPKEGDKSQYPIKVNKVVCVGDMSTMRAVTNNSLQETGRTILAKNTFYNDAVVAWNLAPEAIKKCATIWSAKNRSKNLSKNYLFNMLNLNRLHISTPFLIHKSVYSLK